MATLNNFKDDINTEEDDLNWLAINFNIKYLNSLRSKKFKYKTNLILELTKKFLSNELKKKKKIKLVKKKELKKKKNIKLEKKNELKKKRKLEKKYDARKKIKIT